MGTGLYSAGTAFLSVVPSFANVESAMADELRKMGAKLDAAMQAGGTNGLRNAGKSATAAGKKAAEDYSGAFNKDINKNLRGVLSDIPVWDGSGNSPWGKALDQVRKDIHELSNEKIGITIDENTAFRSIENMRDRLRTLEGTAPDAAGFHNAREARRRLDAVMGTIEDARRQGVKQAAAYAGAFDRGIKETLSKTSGALRPLTITANTSEADREISDLKVRIDTLSGKTIGVDISSAEAMAEIKAIESALRALDRDGVDIQVRADARAAVAGLQKFREETENGKNGLQNMERAANLTMTRLTYLILLGSSLGSVFVPAAAAAAGAIGFIGTSAAAAVSGVGVLALGMSGLGTAIGALDKYQQEQGKSANSVNQANRNLTGSTDAVRQAELSLANTRRTVAAQQADAELKVREAVRGVAEARHDAGIAARDSARQVSDAQRDLTRSELDAKDARTALNAAIKEAIANEHDLTTALDRNQVDQQKAVTAQLKALNELQALQANPRASEVELRTAKDNYDEQTVRLEELRDKRRDLVAEQEKQTRLGVEGDAKVVAARKAVAAADQKVADDRVKLAREQQDAAERTYQSDKRIAEAKARRTAAELDRDRQREQGQYQIATAMNAVSSAARSQQQATEKMGLAGGAALQNLNTAMAGLSPTQQRFARFIFGLKDDFLQLRAAAADPMLPGFQKAIEMLLPYLPGVAQFIGKIAAQLGSMAVQAAAALQGPVWRKFFDYIDTTAVPAMQTWFDIASNLTDGLLSLYLALTPFDGQVGRGLVGLSEDFAAWAEKLNKTKGYQEFLEYVREHGPEVVDFLGSLAKLAFRLLEALAPVGVVAMHVLDTIADGLNAIPMPVLTVLVATIAALALGMAGLGAVVKAQKFKSQLGDIFGDSARNAVQKYAVNTGLATQETGKFGKAAATAAGSVGGLYKTVNNFPAATAAAFGEKSRGMVEKYAIETGRADKSTGAFGKAAATAGGLASAAGAKVKGLGASMGGVKGAAEGLTGFLGGPWGVALTFATGMIGKYTQQQADQEERTGRLVDALARLRDKYTELTKGGKLVTQATEDMFRAAVLADPDLKKMAVNLSSIGISFDEMVKAATSGDPSKVIRKLSDEIARVDQITADAKQKNTWWGLLTGENTKNADAFKAAQERYEQLTATREAFKQTAREMGLTTEAEKILTAADERATAITAIKNAHQKDGLAVQQQLIGAYDAYGTKIQHLNSFLTAFALGEGDAATRAQALNDIIDDQTKSWRDADEAADTYQTKLLDLHDTLKTNGATLDDHTRAGLANKQAIREAAEAARQLTVQDIAAGVPMDQVIVRHKKRIQALKDETTGSKITGTAVDNLIAKYGDVPTDVMTMLETGNFDKVYNQLALMQFMQQMLAQGKTLDEAKSAWLDKKRIARMAEQAKKGNWGAVTGLATGGPVVGPGTGTSDDVLLWGSDGEHMLTAAEVDAAGGHEAIYAWRKALLAGVPLPRYATGGAIKKRRPQRWPFTVDLSGTRIPTEEEIEASAAERLGGSPLGTADGGVGWRWQQAVLKAAFPNIRFTSTTGGKHAKNSWHYKGRALDMVPFSREIMRWIHDTYGKTTLELIGPYSDLGIWHGQPHAYSAALQRQHANHIHWAYDQGGWLQPGAQQVVNATGRPEAVLNPGQWAAVEAQNEVMQGLVAQANSLGGNTYNFDFANSTLDAARLKSIQQRDEALQRAGRRR